MPIKKIAKVSLENLSLADILQGKTTVSSYQIAGFEMVHELTPGNIRFVIRLKNGQLIPSKDGAVTLNINQIDKNAKRRLKRVWEKVKASQV